jgi:signal recognition particle subunit SRP54
MIFPTFLFDSSHILYLCYAGMPEYLMPKGDDKSSTDRLKKFLYIMDSMTAAELDGKVDFSDRTAEHVKSRVRRIAAGSGSHPKEVMMMLQVHKQFEGMISKMGKSGMIGKGAQAKQQQLAAQFRKNPQLIHQRLNQMDPRVIQQMGGREQVQAMMQQMAKGGGPPAGGLDAMMQGMGGMPGMGMPGMGMPDMGAGGFPNMGGSGQMPQMPPGMNMESLMQMAQAMGMGGGMPNMGR